MEIRSFREAGTEPVVALRHACGLTRPWNDPGPVHRGRGPGTQPMRRVLAFSAKPGYAQDEAVSLGKRLIPDH